uniref:DUF155 domain-containing protein n=1 Tax=Trichogramma kaykai TaxID=54128 RepID=A0ABD2XLI0_9HYME
MFAIALKCFWVPKTSCYRSINLTIKISTNVEIFRQIHNVPKKQFQQGLFLHSEPKLYSKNSFLNGTNENVNNINSLQMKKRPMRKKKILEDEDRPVPGYWSVKALATADEYDLENLMEGLLKQDLYCPMEIQTPANRNSFPDAIQAVAKYEVGSEPREIYFFREGTTVMWNVSELECSNVLQFLKQYEESSYSSKMVQDESETMLYTYADHGKQSHIRDGNILLSHDASLDKYTFSNAISQSVKLGIWEASLEQYIESIEFITNDLKAGRKIRMTRPAVLRKQGELFALRHFINLSSDLLDTPDFYWERDDLETLYQQICGYYSIAKRTRVMNEKLNHCVELVELLSSHLSDRHHVRLEWMIILLIMVEVGFETLHYIDRYLTKENDTEIHESSR